MKLDRINNPLFDKFGNFDFLTEKFTPRVIYNYFSVDYGRVGGTTEYDNVIKCCTRMYSYFNKFLIQKDFIFKPRIDS